LHAPKHEAVRHVCLWPDSVAKLCFVRFLDVRFFYKRTFPIPHSADAGAGLAFIGLLFPFLAWISGCPWDWR
jgi:hypothetical protein